MSKPLPPSRPTRLLPLSAAATREAFAPSREGPWDLASASSPGQLPLHTAGCPDVLDFRAEQHVGRAQTAEVSSSQVRFLEGGGERAETQLETTWITATGSHSVNKLRVAPPTYVIFAFLINEFGFHASGNLQQPKPDAQGLSLGFFFFFFCKLLFCCLLLYIPPCFLPV